ncbi:MAG: hypothetical protein VKK63_00585 [Synechococcus sp.]|nr:hypothetical protein [Synechococcus sp.]
MDTTDFDGGAKKLQSTAASAASGISNHFKKIALAVAGIGAAFIGVRAAMQSFFAAVTYGGALNDLSARTGETAGNLAILQRAFENAGAGADSVGPVINRLQRAIVEAGQGIKTYTRAFDQLGLSSAQLERMSPTDQLRAVAEAIARLPTDAQRSAVAMQLLGRGGGELMPLLKALNIEFETARDQLGSTPRIIDQTNKYLDAIGDNIGAITQKGREFMVGVLSKIAPALADITDKIAKIDAAALGEIVSGWIARFGQFLAESFKVQEGLERIKLAIEEIGKGNIGEGLELLFKSVRNWGLNAINEILAAAQAGIATIWQTLQDLFRSDGPMGKMFGALFDFVQLKLMAAIGRAMANVPAFLGGGAGHLRAAEIDEGTAQMALARASGFGGQALEDMARIASQTTDRFTANMANAPRPFDMSGREAEVQAITDRMLAPTVDQARRLMQDLQVLQAREPESAERRAKENEIINAIKDMRSNGLSSGAVNRMAEEVSRFATPNGPPQASAAPQQEAKDRASETTLQKVANFLEQLNTKLPQPVLV